jgi:predicted nucleic acid-binding protein
VRRVFVDTSAILALLNPGDQAHTDAKQAFLRLQAQEAVLISTSFVLVETYALLGRRMGLAAVKAFREAFLPLLEVIWVEAELCQRALDFLVRRGGEGLSLVDAVSMQVIREGRIDRVFAEDESFDAAGFPPV